MAAYLQVLTGRRTGAKYVMKGDLIRIGRHPDCEVPLDGNSVSRFHADIVRDETGYTIQDRDSRNHTFVNGKQISRVHLNDQDRVKICETLFVYRVEPDRGDEAGPTTVDVMAAPDDRPSTVLSTLDAGSHAVFASSVRPEAKLRAILEISQAIGQTLSLEIIFEKILECLFRIFPQADQGIVAALEAGEKLAPRATRQRRESDEEVRFSRTLARQAIDERKAILSADAASDARFSLSESIADFRIRSVMCVPLLGVEQRPLGVIQIVALSYNQKFSEDDLQVLVSVATQAAIVMENARLHEETLAQERMRRELAFAAEVQQSFLPHTAPVAPQYEFWAFYESAGEIGGDYYDFVALPGGRQAVIVADVSGKGVPAALLMARVSVETKVALLTHPDDPARAVEVLNRNLCDAELNDRFVTLALAVLDPHEHRATIVCAGHMSPIVRRRDGTTFEPVNDDNRSFALGIIGDAEYRSVDVDIQAGEHLVAYSDGISEAMNIAEEMYSSERLRSLLGPLAASAAKVGEAVISDVRAFSSGRPQHDDMTLVVIGRQG